MSLRMDHFRWISVFLACGAAASCGGASGGEATATPGAQTEQRAPKTITVNLPSDKEQALAADAEKEKREPETAIAGRAPEDRQPGAPDERHEGGVDGVPGSTPDAVGGVSGSPQHQRAATNVVIPFGAGMSRPSMISGRDPMYTKEALANRVEGLIIARCVITSEGSVTHCRIIKSLPHMNAEVLAALQSRRYTPVLFRGRPVAVDYVFNIRLALPKPPPTPPSSSGAPSGLATAPASPPP